MSEPEIEEIDRSRRWDTPYADEMLGSAMSYELVRELMRGPLKHLAQDRKRFPADLELSGILRNDTRIRRFKKGELIIREGEYGNSAFFILNGTVDVVRPKLPIGPIDQRRSTKRKWLGSVARLFRKGFDYPETRRGFQKKNSEVAQRQIVYLQDFSEFLVAGSDTELDSGLVKTLSSEGSQTGEIFGEIAAVSRTPRTASVLAGGDDTRLLEIRWQGLRDIQKYSPGWKEMIDERYRTSSLRTHLCHAEYVENLPQTESGAEDSSAMALLVEHTRFQSYGEYSWKTTFKEMAEAGSANPSEREPVILRQGAVAAELVTIRSGFVRVTRRYNHGEKTVAYLGKGQTYGMLELYHNSSSRKEEGGAEHMTYQHTLCAVGYVDILVIPAPVAESTIIPALKRSEKNSLEEQIKQIRADGELEADRDGNMMEFLLQQRAINGTASMFIDLDRCTHCDDCVRACAATHDDNPRFIRQGPSQNGIQLTHACMHCVDPVCMIGCPTGAIHRDAVGNQVVINEQTCIGCSTCADNCPYENIQMVDIRDEQGDFRPGTRVDKDIGAVRVSPSEDPLRKATKCDLCESLPIGPACVNACPHDALIRVDMSKPVDLFKWMDRR